MRWLLRDGDAGLLVMLLVAGALPGVSDVVAGRALGAAATVGALVCAASAVGLGRRLLVHVRAESMRKQLLRR